MNLADDQVCMKFAKKSKNFSRNSKAEILDFKPSLHLSNWYVQSPLNYNKQEKPEKDLHLHSDQALEIQFFKWICSGVQKYN